MKRTAKVFILTLILATVFAPFSPAQANGFPPCVPFVNWACITWYQTGLDSFQICAEAASGFDINSVIAGIEVEGAAFRYGGGLDADFIPLVDFPVTSGDSPVHFCTKSWNLTGTTGAVTIRGYAAAVIGSDGRLSIPGAYTGMETLCWQSGGWPAHCAFI